MSLIDFKSVPYVPVLGIKNSEMQGLEELPPNVKDAIVPFIILRPWVTSHRLINSTAKIEAAIAKRPIIVDVTKEKFVVKTPRPVHEEIEKLRDSSGGYKNWYDFLAGFDNYIPTLQLTNPSEILTQLPHIFKLGRGCAVRISEEQFGSFGLISAQMALVDKDYPFYFILDYRWKTKDILTISAIAVSVINEIRKNLPNSVFSVTATTFPPSFVNLTEQEIYERRFHDMVVVSVGAECMVYSDRVSARTEDGGGGGIPAPRIDFPLATKWYFFRVAIEDDDLDDEDEDDKKVAAYKLAASKAIVSPEWADLGIWGTAKILATAAGHGSVVKSPRDSTSVRMNIHMYRQSQQGPSPAEVEWSD